jgi:peptidoglycan/LPS O-acetylase OafA/YrhL
MKINYRPEIDGLRAISVYAVIFYHANFILFDRLIFQGGFVGVDIFFVISGYLITSLILNELLETK